jgi:hypothetical protein
MLPVREHIFSLLYDHDCVIIPEFGGFVANLHGSQFNEQAQTIDPPGKNISFNKHLISNDGLLAHAVAKAQGLGYEDALEAIRKEVLGLKEDIEHGKRVDFRHIGVLYRNQDGALQFIPSNDRNFLRTSFGLSQVHLIPATPVVQPVTETAKEVATPAIPLVVAKETEDQKENSPWRRWAAAAVLIPAVLVGGWLVKDQFTAGQTLSLGDFNPMRKKMEIGSNYQPRFAEEDIRFSAPIEEDILARVEAEYPDMNTLYYSFVDGKFSPDGVRIELNKTTPVTEVKTPKEKASSLDLYFIVAGAFQEHNNATNFVTELQSKGFDAAIFAKKGSLHMVSYGSYPNKRAAKKALENIRQTENKKAWLKRK